MIGLLRETIILYFYTFHNLCVIICCVRFILYADRNAFAVGENRAAAAVRCQLYFTASELTAPIGMLYERFGIRVCNTVVNTEYFLWQRIIRKILPLAKQLTERAGIFTAAACECQSGYLLRRKQCYRGGRIVDISYMAAILRTVIADIGVRIRSGLYFRKAVVCAASGKHKNAYRQEQY